MDVLIAIVSGMVLLIGAAFVLIGGIGLLRMPDFFTRLHAAGVTDTMGAGFILVGLALYSGVNLVTVKLLLILLFLLFTSPVSSHALARAALIGGRQPLTFDHKEGEAP